MRLVYAYLYDISYKLEDRSLKYFKLFVCFCVMLMATTGCIRFEKATSSGKDLPKETVRVQQDPSSAETPFPAETNHVKTPEEDSSSSASWRYEDEKNGCYAEWKYDEQTKCLTICGTGGTHDEEETFSDVYKFDVPFSEFENRDEVREVIIEQGITKINRAAFASFTNLERVSIPDSVKKIGDYVFFECTSLQEVTIPDHVKSIGRECFRRCRSLRRLVLGKQVKNIVADSFEECLSLRDISVKPGNPYFNTKYGGLYHRKKKILYFQYQDASSALIAKDTRKIAPFAFNHHQKLKNIKIPISVTEIGGGAFYQCENLRKVTFQKGSKCKALKTYSPWFEYLDYGCFMECKSLQKIQMPDHLQYIYPECFDGCTSLESIHFPESLLFIGGDCFNGCTSLKKVYFGEKFEGYVLVEEDYPTDLNKKNYTAYQKEHRLMYLKLYNAKALSSVGVSKKNKYFSGKNNLIYDKNKEILYVCPRGKKASKLKLPQTVNKICDDAFAYCKNIQAVEIPNKNVKISGSAFRKSKDIIIYGKKNSTAQKYAKKHKMKFVTTQN